MKVKELIKNLKKEDPEKLVFIPHDDGEHKYYLVYTVRSIKIELIDGSENVIIIDME